MTPTTAYTVGIVGGVSDWQRAGWDEHRMGSVRENADGYLHQSVINRLGDLHGELMLIRGTSDTSTPIANAMLAIKQLQRQDKPHRLVLIPGMGHSPDSGEDLWTIFSSLWRFVEEELSGTGSPPGSDAAGLQTP